MSTLISSSSTYFGGVYLVACISLWCVDSFETVDVFTGRAVTVICHLLGRGHLCNQTEEKNCPLLKAK